MIAAIATGASCGQAAERFGVAKASAICRHARFRAEGEIAAKPMGGDRHSHRIEGHAVAILQDYAARPSINLREVEDALEQNGATASLSGLSRFFRHHGITPKGDLHAAERGRLDVMEAREAWFERQPDLDPERVVSLDETATATDMARRYGRAPRGERRRIAVPHGRYETTAMAALRASRPFVIHLMEGATNGTRFRTYAADSLVPALTPGDTVVMDNLARRRRPPTRRGGRGAPARPAALPSRPQPDRKRLRQAEGPAAHGGGPHRPGPVGRHP